MRLFISFDFDRTLADFSRAHGNSLLAGIQETFNISVNWFDLDQANKHAGLTDLQIITYMIHNHGISLHTIFENMNSCLRNINKNFYNYGPIYPVELLDATDEILNKLSYKDNVILGLSTGNIKSICLEKSKQAGIEHYFNFGSFGNEVFTRYQLLELTKKRLVREFNFSKNDKAFHVGDSILDVLSAKKAGFIPIGVATGNNSNKELAIAGAQLVFDNLVQFYEYIDSLKLQKSEEKIISPFLY